MQMHEIGEKLLTMKSLAQLSLLNLQLPFINYESFIQDLHSPTSLFGVLSTSRKEPTFINIWV
jgi:hypothetical protein